MTLRRLVLTIALLAPAAASAQTSLTFDASQPNAYNNGSYLVGPFDGTFTNAALGQTTGITMFCVDILNTVNFGQTWSVNVTSLANGANDASTRHPGKLTQYREAAWLSNLFTAAPQTDWGSIQYAMWGLLNPGSAPTTANSPSYVTLADYAASQNFGAFTYNAVSYAAFDYSRYAVLTDVGAAGLASGGGTQEFITGTQLPMATPEPASLALVASGLLALAGALRYRRALA